MGVSITAAFVYLGSEKKPLHITFAGLCLTSALVSFGQSMMMQSGELPDTREP